MGVAETPIAAACQRRALADRGEISEQGLAVLVINLRSSRNLEHDVVRIRAVAILAHAGAAVLGFEMLLVAIVDQGVEAVYRQRDHVTALAAVAAIGSAKLDELFAPERHTAVPAVAGANVNLGFVEEFHGRYIAVLLPSLNLSQARE